MMPLERWATVALLLCFLAQVQAGTDWAEQLVAQSCGVSKVDFTSIKYDKIVAACGSAVPQLNAQTCPRCMCAMEQALDVPVKGILAEKKLAAYEQLSKFCRDAIEGFMFFNADLMVSRARGIATLCKVHAKPHAAYLADCSG